MLGAVEQVVGTKVVKVRKEKGDAWVRDEVKEVVKQKRDIRDIRKRKFMECKRRVKWVIEQSKMKVEKNFGRKLSEMYEDNKRLYWKKVQKKKERKWMEQWRGGSEG